MNGIIIPKDVKKIGSTCFVSTDKINFITFINDDKIIIIYENEENSTEIDFIDSNTATRFFLKITEGNKMFNGKTLVSCIEI